MDNEAQKKVKARISRITGQVSGIGRIIDEDRYCVDILNQISPLAHGSNLF